MDLKHLIPNHYMLLPINITSTNQIELTIEALKFKNIDIPKLKQLQIHNLHSIDTLIGVKIENLKLIVSVPWVPSALLL